MVGPMQEMKIENHHQPLIELVKKEPILDHWFVDAPAAISNSNSETKTDHNESTTDINKGQVGQAPNNVTPPATDLTCIRSEFSGTRRPDQDSGLSSGTNTTCSILSHDVPLNEEGSLNEGSYSEVFTDDEEQKEEQEEGEVQVIEGEVRAAIIAPSEDVQTVTLPTNRFAITNLESQIEGDIGPSNLGSKSESLEHEDILISSILKEREMKYCQTSLEPVRPFRHPMSKLPNSDYSELLKTSLDRSKRERPPHELEDLKKLDPNILPVRDYNDDVYSFLVEPKLEQSVKESRDNVCIETYYHRNECTTTLSSYQCFVNVFKDVSETMIVSGPIPVPSSVWYEYVTAPKMEMIKLSKEELIIGRNPINKGYACQIRDELMLKIVEDKLQTAKGTLILLKEKEPPDTHRDDYCCSDYWSFQTMIDQSGPSTLCMTI